MKRRALFQRVAILDRRLLCAAGSFAAMLIFAGCDSPDPLEIAAPWDNFASSGWYAADPGEYGDCATGMEQLSEDDATRLRLAFDMQGVNFATYRNHEILVADWTDRQALVVDVENQSSIPLGITLFLSNEEDGPVWHQSMRHPIPAGETKNVRFGLRPVSQRKEAPKDWTEDAWQFMNLDLTDIKRVAVRVHAAEGTDGVAGTVVVANPRMVKRVKSAGAK